MAVVLLSPVRGNEPCFALFAQAVCVGRIRGKVDAGLSFKKFVNAPSRADREGGQDIGQRAFARGKRGSNQNLGISNR